MSNWHERYRGLCQSLVRRFIRSGVERDDLEQVAALGLIKAKERYVEGRGVEFTTYAWYIICGELLHYVRDIQGAIRLPRRIWQLERSERELTERFIQERSREPYLHEIASELGVSTESVCHIRERGVTMLPLHERNACVDEDIDQRWIVNDALKKLPKDEQTMILGVYYWGYSQSEIGARLGYQQRRASRLHARAIGHLAALVGEHHQ